MEYLELIYLPKLRHTQRDSLRFIFIFSAVSFSSSMLFWRKSSPRKSESACEREAHWLGTTGCVAVCVCWCEELFVISIFSGWCTHCRGTVQSCFSLFGEVSPVLRWLFDRIASPAAPRTCLPQKHPKINFAVIR